MSGLSYTQLMRAALPTWLRVLKACEDLQLREVLPSLDLSVKYQSIHIHCAGPQQLADKLGLVAVEMTHPESAAVVDELGAEVHVYRGRHAKPLPNNVHLTESITLTVVVVLDNDMPIGAKLDKDARKALIKDIKTTVDDAVGS